MRGFESHAMRTQRLRQGTYRGYIGVVWGLYLVYIVIMETTIVHWGCSILG